MSEIIVGFSTHKDFSLVSNAIRAVEKTPYSHVYVRFYSASIDRWLVYHANRDNLNFDNLFNFMQVNKITQEFKLAVTEAQHRDIVQYCVDNVHRKYGIWTLVGIAVVRAWQGLTGKQTKNPFYDREKTQICSELAGHVLHLAGVPIDLALLEVEGPRYIYECLEVAGNAELVG